MRLVAAVLIALGGLWVGLGVKYRTASPCAAARIAVEAELPAVMAELESRDPRFAVLNRGRGRFRRLDAAIDAATQMRIEERLAELSGFGCAAAVLLREVSPSTFHRLAADRVQERMAERGRF